MGVVPIHVPGETDSRSSSCGTPVTVGWLVSDGAVDVTTVVCDEVADAVPF
jgi:hypothetical protein